MASSISTAAILLLFVGALLSLQTAPVSAADRLYAGQLLGPGQSIAQGPYILIMQQDCNLVLYDKNIPVWQSKTNGRASGCYVIMQRDGNLVIYSGKTYIASSKSNRQIGNYYLILQRDRNVVIYDTSNNVLWQTHTNIGNVAIAVTPQSNDLAAASSAAQELGKKLHP